MALLLHLSLFHPIHINNFLEYLHTGHMMKKHVCTSLPGYPEFFLLINHVAFLLMSSIFFLCSHLGLFVHMMKIPTGGLNSYEDCLVIYFLMFFYLTNITCM